ncbi:MAG: hypothetical protein SFW67_36260 [Myxococcaceae bacterium]|nr:hypothetical protein [Myxococcaceae bacterium]
MSHLGCGGGVGPGGELCNAITLDTPLSSLPLMPAGRPTTVSFTLLEPFIEGTGELHCCVANPAFTPAEPVACEAVDCEALRARLSIASLGPPYFNAPCGTQSSPFFPPGGQGRCSVYLDGDRIVGVRASCLD